MSKDLYKALRCFLVEFQDLNSFHATDNFTAMHFLQAIPGKGEPRCVHMLDNTRLCQVHSSTLWVVAGSGRVVNVGSKDSCRFCGKCAGCDSLP